MFAKEASLFSRLTGVSPQPGVLSQPNADYMVPGESLGVLSGKNGKRPHAILVEKRKTPMKQEAFRPQSTHPFPDSHPGHGTK